jgi:hypothetical protein
MDVNYAKMNFLHSKTLFKAVKEWNDFVLLLDHMQLQQLIELSQCTQNSTVI